MVGGTPGWRDDTVEYTGIAAAGAVDVRMWSSDPRVSFRSDRDPRVRDNAGLRQGAVDCRGGSTAGARRPAAASARSTSPNLAMTTTTAGGEYAPGAFDRFDPIGRGEALSVAPDVDESAHALVGCDSFDASARGAGVDHAVTGEARVGF